MENFSTALEGVKKGERWARAGWNGKGMFIYLVAGSHFKVNRAPLNRHFSDGTDMQYHAHVDMFTAQGYAVPWVVSQADLLADDWLQVADY